MERLKKRAGFLYVAGGVKWVSDAFVLQARARKDGAPVPARTGFTASRRVGNAVLRNRARRRLKEAARSVLEGHDRPGHDYVLVARRGALTHRYADILSDLATALKNVHRRLDEGPRNQKSGTSARNRTSHSPRRHIGVTTQGS